MIRIFLLFLVICLSWFRSYAQETLVTYIPEKYEEYRIDTLLDASVNLRILVVRKTLMNDSVALTYILENSESVTHVYRDYTSEITVFNGDSIIFDRTFNKRDFKEIKDEEFLELAITHGTWIQEYDNRTKTIRLGHVLCVPETDWNYFFTLVIDNKGNFHSEMEETE